MWQLKYDETLLCTLRFKGVALNMRERGDTAKFGTRLYVQRIHEKLRKKLDEIGRSRLKVELLVVAALFCCCLHTESVISFPSGKWPATNKNPFIATINHSEFKG